MIINSNEDDHQDFITHFNYIDFLNNLSKGVSISRNLTIEKRILDIPIINKKVNLVKLTLKGIEVEHKIIIKEEAYAVVCVSWISVKAYYLLYNLCLILKYLVTGNKTAFNSSHLGMLKDFKGYISRNELVFSVSEFNQLHSCKRILSWKSRSGSNIRSKGVDNNERLLQIIKKLANYSLEEFKRTNNIKSFRSKKDKLLFNNRFANEQISICGFFYWYRIKANYRDLEYLNKNIGDDKFRNFYDSYYELTVNFYKAFKVLINDIAKIRLGRELL
jgi:hypothetical protein